MAAVKYDAADGTDRRIDNLSLENATEVFVEALPQNIAGAARGTITLHYESQAASFTETLEVVIADTRASLLSRDMLVNDDNDDMLAYPWNTPESRKTSPFNAEMDKDQPTAVEGEDDLRMVRFSAPTGCYPLLVQRLHLDVSGGIRLWKDSRRQEELTRRDWTELEISAQPLMMSPSCYSGYPMTDLTVWVEGLAASAQPLHLDHGRRPPHGKSPPHRPRNANGRRWGKKQGDQEQG